MTIFKFIIIGPLILIASIFVDSILFYYNLYTYPKKANIDELGLELES